MFLDYGEGLCLVQKVPMINWNMHDGASMEHKHSSLHVTR